MREAISVMKFSLLKIKKESVTMVTDSNQSFRSKEFKFLIDDLIPAQMFQFIINLCYKKKHSLHIF